jgi:hypothetical protein
MIDLPQLIQRLRALHTAARVLGRMNFAVPGEHQDHTEGKAVTDARLAVQTLFPAGAANAADLYLNRLIPAAVEEGQYVQRQRFAPNEDAPEILDYQQKEAACRLKALTEQAGLVEYAQYVNDLQKNNHA